jgi:hypothetical protein
LEDFCSLRTDSFEVLNGRAEIERFGGHSSIIP